MNLEKLNQLQIDHQYQNENYFNNKKLKRIILT